MPSGNLYKLVERLHVKFVGGRLCLDFVNTVGGRAAGAVIRDKIGAYADWLDWSRLAGTLTPASARALAWLAERRPDQAAAVMRRAVCLREALYRILTCARDARRPAPADVELLRAELAVARAHQCLTPYRGRFSWTFPAHTESLDRFLWPVPLSAAELLTSPDVAALRQCAGPDCGWLFLDTSRNHQRRWCDMQDCGNRAKVRRFRAKVS